MKGINKIIIEDKSKFLFILCAITIIILLTSVILVLFIQNSTTEFHIIILKTIVFIVFMIGIYLLILYFNVVRIINGKTISKLYLSLINKSLQYIYPIMMFFANLFDIDKNSVRRVFSQINNQTVSFTSKIIEPEEVLVLAPHCLQKSFCKHKIIGNINNCQKCGACDINDLLEICKKYNVKLEIVTGGTLARKLIKEHKPKGIVAVACERDLCNGIIDTKDIPVIGVANERPEGPCFNTRVNTDEVENAIKFFIGR